MIKQKLVDEPLFGCYMGDVNKGDGEGELTFGYVNSEHYTGDIHWAPVIRKAYWEVGIDQVTLGGKPLKVSAKGAAIDTG
jgi:saccharopepsin